jgi:hypothetical protein
MINPAAHADAILSWMESEIGTVSRDELRKRIEDEVRDVARRAYDETLYVISVNQHSIATSTIHSNKPVNPKKYADTTLNLISEQISALKEGL